MNLGLSRIMQQKVASIVGEVARHEAGHYVVGRCLGFTMSTITIRIDDLSGAHQADATVTLPQPCASLDTITDYAEKRVQMLYAGSLAQALQSSEINNDTAIDIIRNKGGRSDHEKARELIQIIRNIKHSQDVTEEEAQKHLAEIDGHLWTSATALVKAESQTIHELGRSIASEVKELRKQYTLTSEMINVLPEIVQRFSTTTPAIRDAAEKKS